MYLELKDIKKSYKDFNLEVNISVEKGEFLSILGPSGSGKSTVLSIIAGLESPDSGSVILDGRDITGEEIQKREIGLVFQEFSLFENMNVQKNITYAMDRKIPKKKKNEAVAGLLKLVGLSGYEKRNVSSLSGGEAQRIALARTLASEPKILLLDEPLSALDAPLRKYLRTKIREIHDQLGITVIHVTHDREEAFAISDRIVIMSEGKVEKIGKAEELYRKPSSPFLATFLGDGTFIPRSLLEDGNDGFYFFRPESVLVSEGDIERELSTYIVLKNAKILSSEFQGGNYILTLDYKGIKVTALTSTRPKKEYVDLAVMRNYLNVF